jgi:hypothetical protein
VTFNTENYFWQLVAAIEPMPAFLGGLGSVSKIKQAV